jgi:two-component system KDP operon response regulator KdpE
MPTRLAQLLVVEDDPAIRELLRLNLLDEGFLVATAGNGEDALRHVRDDLPDLVLLDLTLPDTDGFEVLRQLRAASTVPVIILSARDAEGARVAGLERGADDYVTKPFSTGELVARVRATLRRADWRDGGRSGLVRVDEYLTIDFDEREVIVAGGCLPLRPTEYRLLYHLVRNAGHTLPFETILARVWGPAYRQETQYVHLYVTYLRQKIEPDPHRPRYILTRRGVGYRFRALAGR